MKTPANALGQLKTPVGVLFLAAAPDGLNHIQIEGSGKLPGGEIGPRNVDAARHLKAALGALSEYFAGRRRDFSDLTLAPAGTPFQLAVWHALRSIPFGETRSYGDIAHVLGQPRAARAVGMANNRNPLAIVIPCHRVIGANGSLVGYGGGLPMKQWLLEHEQARRRQ